MSDPYRTTGEQVETREQRLGRLRNMCFEHLRNMTTNVTGCTAYEFEAIDRAFQSAKRVYIDALNETEPEVVTAARRDAAFMGRAFEVKK